MASLPHRRASVLRMSDVTSILSQIESGDPSAAEQLLPLVYDELRKLAAAKLSQEQPGQSLEATALVHDAYVRLVDVAHAQHWPIPEAFRWKTAPPPLPAKLSRNSQRSKTG